MRAYLSPGLLVVVWSIVIVLSYNHFIQNQNPFVGSLCSLLLLAGVLIQLIRLRRRGVGYISVFLFSLGLVTLLLLYADNRLFSPARRYYGYTR